MWGEKADYWLEIIEDRDWQMLEKLYISIICGLLSSLWDFGWQVYSCHHQVVAQFKNIMAE